MKKITLLLTILLVACVGVKAQGLINAFPITIPVLRALKQKTLEAERRQVCQNCGKEITHQGQHCEATKSTGLCVPAEVPTAQAPTVPAEEAATPYVKAQDGIVFINANITHCPQCGQELTIDERFHGVEHICKKNTSGKVYCHRCGEEITHPGQHCDAAQGTALCSAEPEEKPKADTHFPPTHCDKCGQELTIDERFHGVEHVCKTDEQTYGTCYKCGKKITHQGQHCEATDGTSLCSAKVEKGKTYQLQRVLKRVCPKCGAEFTIDELYHGAEHSCKK